MEYELAWPMAKDDYLLVCDCHPQSYISSSALMARLGEDAPEPESLKPSGLHDYQVVATRVGLRWMTLMDLSNEMECSPREVASLAKHLADAVARGLLERHRVPRTIRGMARLRWCYRKLDQPQAPDRSVHGSRRVLEDKLYQAIVVRGLGVRATSREVGCSMNTVMRHRALLRARGELPESVDAVEHGSGGN